MQKTFHEDLKLLEKKIMGLGALVQFALDGALNALEKRDYELAEKVIDGDDEIDKKYIEIEQVVLELLARHAPVARDLRLISAILHINIHLERMADLCVDIARFVTLTKEFIVNQTILENLLEMGDSAQKMIATSLRAFSERDIELAKNLPKLDDPIDKLNRRIFKEIAASALDEKMLDWATRMVLVSRYLERFGDHAVDIGEQVAFLLTGKVQEFESTHLS
jgi:phosphate transport system protein